MVKKPCDADRAVSPALFVMERRADLETVELLAHPSVSFSGLHLDYDSSASISTHFELVEEPAPSWSYARTASEGSTRIPRPWPSFRMSVSTE